MGTSLTGLTPATTYDALIKVGDNGPLSATAKVLSDGLGNDSPLAMSTTAVGIGTSSPAERLEVAGSNVMVRINAAVNSFAQLGFYEAGSLKWNTYNDFNNDNYSIGNSGGTHLAITAAGNVGIGTSSPSGSGWDEAARILHIYQNTTNGALLRLESSNTSAILNAGNNAFSIFTQGADDIRFGTSGTERMRVTDNGLTFNGDTAAANALDDYEEGTWTPAINFSGASVGLTYNFRSGIYQKIGNKVTLNCFISVSDKGTSTGDLFIGGFPFALLGATSNYCPVALRPSAISFADQMIGYAEETATQCAIQEISSGGSVTAINDANCSTAFSMMMQITYFV